MRKISFVALAAALGACTTAPPPAAPSPEAQAELQQLLTGKVAGQPMSCLSSWRADDMRVIDDNTVAFKQGSTVYVSEMRPGCPRLDSGAYALVTRSFGNAQLCSGEIAQVANTQNGMVVGSCVFGDFVPYRQP